MDELRAGELPSLPTGLTLDLIPRTFPMHYVHSRELDGLVTLGIGASVLLASFTFFAGAFISIMSALQTSSAAMSGRLYEVYVGCAVGSAGLAILCGVLFAIAFRFVRKDLRDIKRDPRRVPTISS